MEFGANEFTIKDIEQFLNSEGAESPAADEEQQETAPQTQGDEGKKPDVTETQAFAHRLKEATTKARREERDNMAKELGYESYDDLVKSREKSLLEQKGLDPDEVAPVVEEIVQKRLAEDPRLKELEELKEKKAMEWAKHELAELKTLTNGRISKLEDVPKDVVELWKQKGSLKAAYLELKGEELIREMQKGVASVQSKASTSHMQSPHGAPPPMGEGNRRPFTQKEKDIYRLFNPDVTDEELSKMTKSI